jgi:hypothetical protein
VQPQAVGTHRPALPVLPAVLVLLVARPQVRQPLLAPLQRVEVDVLDHHHRIR